MTLVAAATVSGRVRPEAVTPTSSSHCATDGQPAEDRNNHKEESDHHKRGRTNSRSWLHYGGSIDINNAVLPCDHTGRADRVVKTDGGHYRAPLTRVKDTRSGENCQSDISDDHFHNSSLAGSNDR